MNGINDAGWIIGTYLDSGNSSHCALWKPDAKGAYSNPVSFDVPGQTSPSCTGINGLGQIVGWSVDPNGGPYTTFIDDAEGGDPGTSTNFTSITDPNIASSSDDFLAYGINNNGLIVGNDWTTGQVFLADSQDFDTFAGPVNAWPFYLYGINDDSQLVGIAYPAPNPSDPSNPAGVSSGIIVNALPLP